MDYERVLYEGSVHPDFKKRALLKQVWTFIPSIFVILIPLIVFNVTSGLIDDTINIFSGINLIFLYMTVGIIIFGIFYMVFMNYYFKAYIKNFSFKITASNITIKKGVYNRIQKTIPYSRIQDVTIRSVIFDRKYDLHNVLIQTGGYGGYFPEGVIPGQKDPELIEKTIKDMLKRHS